MVGVGSVVGEEKNIMSPSAACALGNKDQTGVPECMNMFSGHSG